MEPSVMDTRRAGILAVTLLLGLWAVFGLADLPHRPYAGFRRDAAGVVTSVAPGTPADHAGLRAGDRILSINGIPLTDTTRLRHQPREAVGETHPIVVARIDAHSGETTEEALNLKYTSELGAYPIGLLGSALLGLAFLLCAVLAYLRSPSHQSLLFAIASLCLAGVLVPDPHISGYHFRTLLEAAKFLVAFPAFACLLHLTLIFPEPYAMVERRATLAAIYLPACLLGAAGAVQAVRGRALGLLMELLGLVLLLGYMLLSVAALVHRYATTPRAARVAAGLHLLVGGIVLGFGPLAFEALAALVAPGLSLPGRDYYFLAMLLIPVSFLVALSKSSAHRHGVPASLAATN